MQMQPYIVPARWHAKLLAMQLVSRYAHACMTTCTGLSGTIAANHVTWHTWHDSYTTNTPPRVTPCVTPLFRQDFSRLHTPS